jgi:hypothetical protein
MHTLSLSHSHTQQSRLDEFAHKQVVEESSFVAVVLKQKVATSWPQIAGNIDFQATLLKALLELLFHHTTSDGSTADATSSQSLSSVVSTQVTVIIALMALQTITTQWPTAITELCLLFQSNTRLPIPPSLAVPSIDTEDRGTLSIGHLIPAIQQCQLDASSSPMFWWRLTAIASILLTIIDELHSIVVVQATLYVHVAIQLLVLLLLLLLLI